MKKVTSKFPGKRALVVEDYFINQEVTQDILELMELDVEVAENGREALELYQKEKYDLIFMDIQMPEMDGYQTTKEIRRFENKEKRVPIIALTANALSGDREKCLEAGMDDYISKPIEAEKIEEILKKYLPS
jgi:CheY-like chemotaxis protein